MFRNTHNLKFKFLLNLFFCILFYLLKTPVFPQNEENINLLNSNEEIRAEYGNWLQVCQKAVINVLEFSLH